MALAGQALNTAHRLDLNPAILTLYQTLAESYRHFGQLRKAHEYQARAFQMERAIFDEDRLRSIDELEIRYQTAETEKALALAENENLLKARQLLRQYWAITLLASGLSFAIVLLLYFRKQKEVARLTAARERAKHEQSLTKLRAEKEFAALQALFAGQEQERRRVANDLHDSLGGLLYALRLQLPANAPEKARRTLDSAVAENRRISQALLPPALARVGLCAALREWREQFGRTFELPLRLDLPEHEPRLPDDVATNLFRIAQELTTNAAKHAAGARGVTLLLKTGTEGLTLRVDDDGEGFDQAALPETAFKTVQSRVRLLDGQLDVTSEPGKGTTVSVTAPVNQA